MEPRRRPACAEMGGGQAEGSNWHHPCRRFSDIAPRLSHETLPEAPGQRRGAMDAATRYVAQEASRVRAPVLLGVLGGRRGALFPETLAGRVLHGMRKAPVHGARPLPRVRIAGRLSSPRRRGNGKHGLSAVGLSPLPFRPETVSLLSSSRLRRIEL